MGMQTYALQTPRLGKMAGEILGHAIATEVLVSALSNKDMPKNKSDTMVFRSWVPYGATASAPNVWAGTYESGTASGATGYTDIAADLANRHITVEGVTPAADTIAPRDVTVVLQQYMALYALTDKDYDMYEDDITEAMKVQTGERMGLVRELVVFGQLKACTNKFYAGASGATVSARASIPSTGVLHAKHIAKIIRNLKANHAKSLTKILPASPNYNTKAIEASYICYVHTDAEYDVRNLSGFIPVAQYGSRQPISEYELGSYQNVRFILSAEMAPYYGAGSGGTAGTTSALDVYPYLFMAQDAAAAVKLRGSQSIDPILLLPNQKDKNDPGGQRGYVGAKFWFASAVLNPGWMAVLEAVVTDI